MKMYTDYTVEGTPEEVAAFKHIDAALAARNGRAAMRAIEAPKKKPPAKKVPSTRVPAKRPRKPRSETQALHEQILKLIGSKDGITSKQIAEYLEVNIKTVYNHLYRMVQQGDVVRDNGLYHRVPVNVA
jgi:DNA-binding CsgD family transcriptional regulator